ncbi:MAG: hypothetical protein JST79_12730 [Acidobacteria bacterium]|jgi:hypothetical protein|nr:hypothetical protein [Acidobacteriota bacterium]
MGHRPITDTVVVGYEVGQGIALALFLGQALWEQYQAEKQYAQVKRDLQQSKEAIR